MPYLILVFLLAVAASAPVLAAAVQGTARGIAEQELARTAYAFGRGALDEEPPDPGGRAEQADHHPPASGSMHTHHQHTRADVDTAAAASVDSSPDDTGVLDKTSNLHA